MQSSPVRVHDEEGNYSGNKSKICEPVYLDIILKYPGEQNAIGDQKDELHKLNTPIPMSSLSNNSISDLIILYKSDLNTIRIRSRITDY
jgi:hypothetical protein